MNLGLVDKNVNEIESEHADDEEEEKIIIFSMTLSFELIYIESIHNSRLKEYLFSLTLLLF